MDGTLDVLGFCWSFRVLVSCLVLIIIILFDTSGICSLAQRKRVGLITQRS